MESSSEEEAKGISGGEEGAQFSYPMINPHHHQNQIHHNTSFQSTAPPPPPSSDMFNEEMIHHSSSIWKPFFPKDGGSGGSGSPKSTPAGDDHEFYQFNPTAGMMTSTVDEDPNNNNNPPPPPPRSSSTLSLSLSSTIGLQQQNQMAAAAMLQTGGNMNPSLYEFELRRSRYMVAAQELLNEFCSLGSSTKQTDAKQPLKSKPLDVDDDDDNDDTSSSSSRRIKPSPGSLEFLELQKRKTKLYSLLEEVDRKYRHYCEQMKAVVSSFESVAGAGAAGVYSVLASKAMSRHFRCLRDGIVAQIQATRKTMGEKDPVAPGTTRGETPRLKVIDQTIRQHKAFQQMNMMESHPWRPQRGLPERSVSVLRAWLFEHFLHPYPSDVDKHILARQTGLSRSQVSNWFINARVRLWKPMVEELYVEETKDHEDNLFNNNNNNLMLTSSDGEVATTFDDHNLQDDDNNNMNIRMLSSSTSNYLSSSDQKPTQDQLIRLDPDCLSSIISNSDHHKAFQNHHQEQQQHMAQNQNHAGFGAFGAVELDHFSAYNHQSSTSTSHLHHHHHHHHQQQLGGGVSLTLGLQQHGGGGGGVSLAFTPVASQSSNLFFPRDHNIEQQEQVHHHHQYSLLEGDHDQGQNLPYRNLMGAQLLRDFAG